jgi:type IV secretion system protein VirB10
MKDDELNKLPNGQPEEQGNQENQENHDENNGFSHQQDQFQQEQAPSGEPEDNGNQEDEEQFQSPDITATEPNFTDNEQNDYEASNEELNIGNEEVKEKPTPYSIVAQSTNTKRMLIIVGLFAAVIAAYIALTVISNDPARRSKERQQQIEEKKQELLNDAKPITPIDQMPVAKAPPESIKLPEPLQIKAPEPPAPPAPPPPAAPPPSLPAAPLAPQIAPGVKGQAPLPPGIKIPLSAKPDDKEALKAQARRKAGIMVTGGGGSGSNQGATAGNNGGKPGAEASATPNKFLGFSDGALVANAVTKTAASQVEATYIGQLDTMIAQGKIINAILETAINTDLPGTLRAIVTRDVYAESGKAILIPKGSRVIGTYQTQLKPGQVRVAIKWDRLIRPDGIDLQLGSDGTDELGRTGVVGDLDNKFWQQMGLAVLTSYIIPIIAENISNVNDQPVSQAISTSNGTTSATTTSTGASAQLQQSTQQFQNVANQAITNSFSATPTITIEQGTRVNIFVNKDLLFPSDIMINTQKIIR